MEAELGAKFPDAAAEAAVAVNEALMMRRTLYRRMCRTAMPIHLARILCPRIRGRSRLAMNHVKNIKENSQEGSHVHEPWAAILDEAYGPDWPSMHLEDAKQCVQWGLGGAAATDSAAKGNKSGSEEGRWACTSALLRDGILAMLGAKSLTARVHDSDLRTKPAAPARSGPVHWHEDGTTWEPPLCSTLRPRLEAEEPKAKCYVRAWKLRQFRELRDVPGPLGKSFDYNERLIASVRSGPLVPMDPGAGKSGSGFAKTADNLFKVKMGLKYDMKMNEPKNLMQLVEGTGTKAGRAPPLAEHLRANPDSIINRYHGMLKIALGRMRSYVVVMDDAFYDMDLAAEEEKEKTPAVSFTRYDLKGASRNPKHTRKTGFCLINGDFTERERGVVRLHGDQCRRFQSALEADVAFLRKHKMIDYSILLLSVMPEEGAEGSPPDWPVKCKPGLGAPFCMENAAERRLYTFSIIDFINDLNHFKQAESCLYGGKFKHYDRQISDYAKKMCPTTAETTDANGDGKVSQEQGAK